MFTDVGGGVVPMCLLVTPPMSHPFSVLPPEIMGGAYLTGLNERAAVVSRHFMVNKGEIKGDYLHVSLLSLLYQPIG